MTFIPYLGPRCDECDKPCPGDVTEDEYGTLLCTNCATNVAETAWERHCEDFHDGGSTQFKSLQEQAIEGYKIKKGLR